MLTRDELVAILEQHLAVTDEWGGCKLAEWKYGYNVCIEGIDVAADALLVKMRDNDAVRSDSARLAEAKALIDNLAQVLSGAVQGWRAAASTDAVFTKTAEQELQEANDKIKYLRELLHKAGHAFQDQWCIDWSEIGKIMNEVDKEKQEDDSVEY